MDNECPRQKEFGGYCAGADHSYCPGEPMNPFCKLFVVFDEIQRELSQVRSSSSRMALHKYNIGMEKGRNYGGICRKILEINLSKKD
jgi:hypothetical protein